MALGDGGNFSSNKDNNNRNYDPTVYVPVRFRNPDAKTDPSELGFSYWSNMLKITISPKLENTQSEYPQYDHNSQNNASILINPIKAKIFHDDIINMIENGGHNSVGVVSGASGIITFSDGKEFGVDGYMLVIRKLDESGNTISSYSYQFNKPEYYFSVIDFDEQSHDYTRAPHDKVEVDFLLNTLEQFYLSQNYAMAYSVVNNVKYDNSRMKTKLDLIMDKLGIQKYEKNTSGQGSRSSFFSSQKAGNLNESMSNAGYNKSTSSTTIEDLSNEIA
jgi:hypothetical protein